MTSMEEMARCRTQMYGFLCTAFLEPPDEEFLKNLTDEILQKELGDLFGREVRAFLAKKANGTPAGIPEIRQDFMDLFKVPLGSYMAPYESVYRDERDVGGKKVRGLLMGPSTVAVQEIYKRAGASIDKTNFKELPDHIATELAFMSFLCTREWDAWKRDDEGEAKDTIKLEREFLDDHLEKWTPALCENIRKRAKTPVYKGIAALLESFLKMEAEILARA
jgi:TorA maturation chaperone TorD